MPVKIGAASNEKCPFVMQTSIPLIVKTNVSAPGRSLKPVFSSRPVPARIAVWASSAAMPMFSPIQGSA